MARTPQRRPRGRTAAPPSDIITHDTNTDINSGVLFLVGPQLRRRGGGDSHHTLTQRVMVRCGVLLWQLLGVLSADEWAAVAAELQLPGALGRGL